MAYHKNTLNQNFAFITGRAAFYDDIGVIRGMMQKRGCSLEVQDYMLRTLCGYCYS